MIPNNLIEKAIGYYFDNPDFKEDTFEAIKEFFDRPNLGQGSVLNLRDEMHEAAFMEWFLYDRKLENGKIALENYCNANPDGWGEADLKTYKDLIDTNKYGAFEIKKIDVGQGAEVCDLQTGKEFYVHEYSGTFQFKEGETVFARIGKVEGRWEFVGGDSRKWPAGAAEEAREMFGKFKKFRLNPKIISDFLKDDVDLRAERLGDLKIISNQEAEERISKILNKSGLDKHISIEKIKQWMRNDSEEDLKSASSFIRMFLGIADDRLDSEEINEIMGLLIKVYNSIPKKYAKNSPQDEPNNPREKNIIEEKVETRRWHDYDLKAHEFMYKQKWDKAIEEFNEVFRIFLEDQTSFLEIYRIFANKAIAHFGAGESYKALKLIEMALELNPNYDFALATLEKYKEGIFDELIQYGVLNKMTENMKKMQKRDKKWGLEKLNKLSVEEILKRLEEIGVEISEREFRFCAQSYVSTTDFNEEILYPRYKGKKEDEDVVSFASDALWEKLCPDILTVEGLVSAVDDLDEIAYEDYNKKNLDKIGELLKKLEGYLNSENSKEIFKRWKEFFEYKPGLIKLKYVFLTLLETSFCDTSLKLAEEFKNKTGFLFFEIVRIAEGIKRGGWGNWEEQAKLLAEKYPYNSDIFADLGHIFDLENELDLAEEYFLKALSVIERREKDKKFDVEFQDSIYDDYDLVFDRLEGLYLDCGEKENAEEVRRKRELVEERKDQLDYSKSDEDFSEKAEGFIEQIELKEFENDPAYAYFEYLKKFNINFATDSLTSTKIVEFSKKGKKMRQYMTNQTKKVGRNDPCPCGSGKKYKKCCGK